MSTPSIVVTTFEVDDDALLDALEDAALLAELEDAAELDVLDDAVELLLLEPLPLQPARTPSASAAHAITARNTVVMFFIVLPFSHSAHIVS